MKCLTKSPGFGTRIPGFVSSPRRLIFSTPLSKNQPLQLFQLHPKQRHFPAYTVYQNHSFEKL
jgi:hypothetical protein